MKIYYFLNDIPTNKLEYFKNKIKLLSSECSVDYIISKYLYKLGDNNEGRINQGFFLDALCFIDVIKNKYNISYEEVLSSIEWVHYNKNFYIHNDDVYVTGDNCFEKINLDEVTYMVTSRDSWQNPFFYILHELSKIHTNLNFICPNFATTSMYTDDKICNISKLYAKRSKYIGNIMIPLLLKKDTESLIMFFKELGKNLGNKVVMKKNRGSYGDNVKMLDIQKYNNEESIDYLKIKYLNNGMDSIYNVYFAPYYEIKNEFRVYFGKNGNNKNVEVYAIKKRVNKDVGNVFEKKNYSLGENVTVDWEYISKEYFQEQGYEKFVKSIGKKLGYDRGVIEVMESSKGEMIYGELNSLGALLIFPEDEYHMIQHWKDLWRNNI